MPDWVHIVHKDLPETLDAPPQVTREAYDDVWKANGWRLAPKSAIPEVVEIPGDISPPSPPSKSQATKKRR